MARRSPSTVFTWISAIMALAGGGAALAQCPPPFTPTGGNILPGPWPCQVTATNMNVNTTPNSVLNGTGSNTLRVTFPSGGPIKWTESRHNEGDIAMLIGPFDPNDPSYYPPDAFVDNYAPGANAANTTYAWRASRGRGALLATVRVNGRDNGDTTNGSTAVGTIYGLACFNSDLGQGWSYLMTDGTYANGGGGNEGSADLQMGIAGGSGGAGEAGFDVAAAFFPYEQGWLGAWVTGSAGTNGEATFQTGNPAVNASSVVWQSATDGKARVTLPGVNSAADGMLFIATTNSSNNMFIAAGAPRNGGWDVTVRSGDNTDTTGQTLAAVGSSQFQFLYVPYAATRLIGGHIDGSTGAVINGGGTGNFSVARTQAGQYAITVNGKTGNDGMLILSVAGHMAGATDLTDRTFLSYVYDSGSGTFIVQSREVTAGGNVFGFGLPLRDSDFYFAYVDFANPLAPPESQCSDGIDNDGNGLTDCADPSCDTSPACRCNVPWADAEGHGQVGKHHGDGDVDQADFAVFQLCFSGAGALLLDPVYCACFDREPDGDIDRDDLDKFLNCVSGPTIPWVASPQCP